MVDDASDDPKIPEPIISAAFDWHMVKAGLPVAPEVRSSMPARAQRSLQNLLFAGETSVIPFKKELMAPQAEVQLIGRPPGLASL